MGCRGRRDSRPFREREGSLSPPIPSFQGLLSADLHMKWYLIHSHSAESPKPAMAEALAEGRPSQKSFNWHVIRLWNCVALLDKWPPQRRERTEDRNRWEGGLQLIVRQKKLIPFIWEMATLLHWMWEGGNFKERMTDMKKWQQKISVDEIWCQGSAYFSRADLKRSTDKRAVVQLYAHSRQWGGGFTSCPDPS